MSGVQICKRSPGFRNLSYGALAKVKIIFEVSAYVNSGRRRPELSRPLGIRFRLHNHQREISDCPSKRSADHLVTTERTSGYSTVSQHRRNAASTALAQEIWP